MGDLIKMSDNGAAAGDFFIITVIDNGIEAQLIGSILTERGIPHRICSHHDTAYDGLFQTQKGWGRVEAPQSCRSQILEIINDVRKNISLTK